MKQQLAWKKSFLGCCLQPPLVLPICLLECLLRLSYYKRGHNIFTKFFPIQNTSRVLCPVPENKRVPGASRLDDEVLLNDGYFQEIRMLMLKTLDSGSHI